METGRREAHRRRTAGRAATVLAVAGVPKKGCNRAAFRVPSVGRRTARHYPVRPADTMKLKLLIGSIISAVFLYLAFRGIQWSVLLDILKRTNVVYLIPAVASTVVQLYLRAYRWGFMLRPVKPVPTRRLFSAASIGYMANNVLPARLGEFVRAHVLGRQENISRTASFATIIYERVADVFALLVMLWFVLLRASGPEWLRETGWWLLALNVVSLAALILLDRYGAWFSRLLEKIIRPLPTGFQQKILRTFNRFVSGLQAVSSIRTSLAVVVSSAAVWLVTLAGIYFCFGALDIKLPPLATLTLQVLVAFGTMIPSAPAYLGTTQYACVVGLALYGVGRSEALAYSILYHATIFFPVTLLGFYFLWRARMRLGDLSRRAQPADNQENQ
jgi:uncharacterized protein (TIRG00374 family)